MTLLNGALDEDARAENILAALGDDPAEETRSEAPVAADEPAAEIPAEEAADESGPEETPVTVTEEGQSDPADEPVIEPPDSWKAEWKERFKAIPRDLQAVIAERDAEQKATFNRQVNEAAERSKAAEAARKAAEERMASTAQEQQRYVQTLAQLTQQIEQADPIISTYNRLLANGELVKLAEENPAEYARLDSTYKARISAINVMRAEQSRVQNDMMAAHFAREEKALVEKLPEWSNPELAHKALGDLRQTAIADYGFRPDEVRTIHDHRYVLLMRDASEAKQLRAKVAELEAKIAGQGKAAKDAIAAKKVTPPPTRTVRPGPASESAAKVASERSKSLLKKARATGNPWERAALIAETLE